MQEEGKVKGYDEVDGPCWQVLDHALLLCSGFRNGLGGRRGELRTIVVAESYRLLDLDFRLGDGFTHLESDHLSNLLKSPLDDNP